MKHILLLFALVSSLSLSGQVSVVIDPADATLCYRDSIAFVATVTGAGSSSITYRWQKNFEDIPGAADSLYIIPEMKGSDAGLYRCIIVVNGEADTSNTAVLTMRPRMYIDTLYRYNPLGCYVECKGQFKTSISGGTPFANDPKYIYEWGGGHSQDTIVFGLCPGKKQFRVTDSLGCRLDTTYLVDFLRSPKIRITFTPTDTVYLTNPTITASFPDSMRQYLSNWTWNLGDSIKIANINPVMHTYSKEFLDTVKVDKDYPVKLMITDKNGCDTTITDSIIFKTAKLVIPNVFTPNGDGANDKFAIELEDDPERDFREAWISNELVVYDRWGRKVHSQVNYKSEDWDGDRLSDGTYFYVLQCIGLYGEEVFRGSLTILRGK